MDTDSSTHWRLEYDVYQYFLPESDLSEHSLIGGMETVARVPGMVENGRKVRGEEKHSQLVINTVHIPHTLAHGHLQYQ